MSEKRHSLPINDMMPKPGPADKEVLYKAPPGDGIRSAGREEA